MGIVTKHSAVDGARCAFFGGMGASNDTHSLAALTLAIEGGRRRPTREAC